MAFWRGTSVEEHKQRSDGSIFSGLLQTLRQGLPTKTEHEQKDDGIMVKIDDALQDACKVVRRSFSSATHNLNEMIRRGSDNRRYSQTAVPPFSRFDSGISMNNRRRTSEATVEPTGAIYQFARVPIQQMPTCRTDNVPSSARRVASSAFSSIQSLFETDKRSNEDNLTANATQQTDDLNNGDPSRYRHTRTSNKGQADLRRIQECSPRACCFKITYHATEDLLEVNFSCPSGFIKSIQENGKAHIVCKLRLSPGKRSTKLLLQKGKVEYSKSSAFIQGLAATELGGKTLNVMVVSKKRAWKMDLMLWRNSVCFQDLTVNKSIELFWRE